jgi:hypothetical protein
MLTISAQRCVLGASAESSANAGLSTLQVQLTGLAGGMHRMQQTQRGWMTGEGEGFREVFTLAVDRGGNACDWNGHRLAASVAASLICMW